MAKITASHGPSGQASGSQNGPLSSSASVHSLQPYHDIEEPEDSPPAYTDADDNVGAPAAVNIAPSAPNAASIIHPRPPIPGGREIRSRGGDTHTITLEPQLSMDPEALAQLLNVQLMLPPVGHVYVKGTHTQTKKNGDKGSTKETVTDFDFDIDTAGTVLPANFVGPGSRWENFRDIYVVRDADSVSAYRGGRFKSKGNRAKAPADLDVEAEGEVNEALMQKNAMEEWCRRFCADKAGVKSFTITRKIYNWDSKTIQQHITSLIRSTNYRGSISVSFGTHHTSLKIYSPSLLNRLRTNTFVWWTCVILQLWILTWPILILLEHRYEIANADWFAKRDNRYACNLSENQWLDLFGPAIQAAAVGRRRNGELLCESEARRVLQQPLVEGRRAQQDSEAERERRERVNSGRGNWADSIVGVARGISEVRGEWEQLRGWGGDC